MLVKLRLFFRILFIWLALGVIEAAATDANESLSIAPIPGEHSVGSKSAPVTLIEYASLTCDYCIRFHRQVFPIIMRNHITTGQVRFIYRDFPTSEEALLAAAASRCQIHEDYFEALATLYRSTGSWMQAMSVEAGLISVFNISPSNQQAFRSCIHDETLQREITRVQQTAVSQGIKGTPTFIINGRIVTGVLEYEKLAALLNAAAGKDQISPKH